VSFLSFFGGIGDSVSLRLPPSSDTNLIDTTDPTIKQAGERPLAASAVSVELTLDRGREIRRVDVSQSITVYALQQCKRVLARRKLSVRPSVSLSNTWIVTKRTKLVPTFLYHTKDYLSYFSEKKNGW